VNVTAHGAAAVTTASIAPNLNVAPGVGGLALQRPSDIRSAFDARLREIARRELAPKVPAAQAIMQRRASFNAIPANPTVGSFVNLNANGSDACTNIKTEVGRVAAISNNAIIIADTTNPSGGFTDDEYKSFATTFDTLINPIDVQAFGQPTDIDNNGKIVIFFTKEVNLLTPRGSPGVIGGFFFERDLFPLSDTNDFAGCAGSNLAEMFYVLVPDPNHVYGDARSKQKVLDVTPGTLAHEYQHLINAGRRMYKNLPFDDFEEVWLNEGLSHIAEELLYYHVSGFAPRQNLDPSKIAATQTAANNFNKYQGDNSGRFETFLNKPSQTSVYGNNDSLETRGATWDLLRYLADHRGSSDGDTWSQLVNTQLTGQANLAHVFGADYMTQISNWATSVFADDIPGVNDPRFLEPSWDMRAIYPRLVDDAGHPLGRYPLQVTPLSDVLPANLSIWTGGAAYLRFSVAPGSQASIDWAAGELPVSPFLQFTVVRTR
jgi:Peptidase M30.